MAPDGESCDNWNMSETEKEILRTHVTVGKDGRIDVPKVDLPEGTKAELTVVVPRADAKEDKVSIADMIGCLRGTYGTAEEIDAHLREEREAWEDDKL